MVAVEDKSKSDPKTQNRKYWLVEGHGPGEVTTTTVASPLDIFLAAVPEERNATPDLPFLLNYAADFSKSETSGSTIHMFSMSGEIPP